MDRKIPNRIFSPMATGNGAHVVHKTLEGKIPSYRLLSYSPFMTLVPPLLLILRRRLRADLIHTTPDYAIFLKKPSIPLVVTFHNYVLDLFMRPYSFFLQRIHYSSTLRIFTKVALRKAHAITAVSRFIAEIVTRDLGLPRTIDIIYNGVDTKKFSPELYKQESREIKVLFSGNLTRRKGVQWLVPIADRLGNHIKIFYTQGLRRQGQLPQHDRLIPIGPIDYCGMPARYREMDILLMPTVREGFSMAVLEAMACALPVVATNCSSLPEQIDDGKGGFLCGLGDVDAFSEKINLLSNSSRLRREMGAYNRVKVEEKFTLDRMVSQYQLLFDQIEHRHRN